MGNNQSSPGKPEIYSQDPGSIAADKVSVVIVQSDDCHSDEEFANIVIKESQVKKEKSFHRSVSLERDGPWHSKGRTVSFMKPPADYFLTAFKKSHIIIDARNIIVLGQTGAGKSSTICHLLGKELPKRPSSTDLIKVIPNVYWQSKRSNKLRKVTPENEFESIKRSVLNEAAKIENFASVSSSDSFAEKDGMNSSWPPKTGLLDISTSTFINSVKKAVTREATKSNLQGLPVPTSQSHTMVLYQFIDCGGMPFFRNLLPQFFPSAENTIFFIVHNLTDKLYARAQVRVLQNGRLIHQDEVPTDNIDEISNWLKIAHSCTFPHSMNHSVGNTFMIGTHFDHLQKICFNNKSLAKEAALTATEHICDRVTCDPSHSVLDPDPVFLQNNLAGTNECPGIQELRKKLWEYQPIAKPIVLPALWAALIKHIKDLAEEGNKPVLPLEQYFQIAKNYHISEDEARNVLCKCQELCLIFRLTSTSYLSMFVFIDMQWLFASLAKILHQPDSYCKSGRYYRDWKELTESGFMSVEFHAHLFFHTPQVECLPSTWASDLLEHLNLMSRVTLEKGNGYFCPILLPFAPQCNKEDPFHGNDADCDALHIIPQKGSIPPGFLARLFTLLASLQKNKVKLVYCSSQVSATYQLFTDDPDESYFLRISEDRGGIKLEFCNVFANRIELLRACSIANRILLMVINAVEVLKTVWKLTPSLDCPRLLEGGGKDFPSLFVKCYNINCCNSYHLSHVHPQPLNKSKPYVQCNLTQRRMFFTNLPRSQMIWLMKLVADESEVDLMKACLTEVNEKLNCDRTVHTYPMYHPMPYSECMKTQYGPITAHPNRITQQLATQRSIAVPSECLMQQDHISHELLKRQYQEPNFALDMYFLDMEDYLDLEICNYLFQYGILSNDERTQILALNSASVVTKAHTAFQPSDRATAIRILMDALKARKTHGFMALIAALQCTANTDTSLHCGHGILLENLQKDSNFLKIKQSWLSSLTVS